MNTTNREKTLLSIDLSKKLTQEIRTTFRPGEILPSRARLAEKYKVSNSVIKETLEILETTGMIQLVRGKGAVILHQKIEYPIHSYTRYTEILENKGRHAETVVLHKLGVSADQETSYHLDIAPDEPVVMLECLGKMDGAPFNISRQYLPFTDMYDVMRKYNGGSLHQFIRDTYKVKLKRILSLITARRPDKRDCEILEISMDTPILQVKSVNVDVKTGKPMEYVDTRFKSTAIELSFDLSGGLKS